MLDGLKGFFTSKRGIGLLVGILASLLSAWKGIEIDAELRASLIANIWKLVGIFVGGVSLSDTFGKGKVAEQARAVMAAVVKDGLDVGAAVASAVGAKPSADSAGGGGGAE